jgi:hypothetical protein
MVRATCGARDSGREGEPFSVWRDWIPEDPRAQLAGVIGDHLRSIIGGRSGVRQVFVLPDTVSHYRENHAEEFDIGRAERLVATVLSDPLLVTQSRQKRNTVVFLGEYDTLHFLAVPVKVLHGELWQESLYIRTRGKVLHGGWRQGELLYERK